MASTSEVFFDFVTSSEVQASIDLEHQAFPPDEADSPEQIRYRHKYAGHLYIGAFVPSYSASGERNGRKLIGHIYATQSPLAYYTRESIKGIGSKLVREFLSRIKNRSAAGEIHTTGKPERILLLSHDDVRPFYEKVGFTCGGKSDVVLGAGVWYEMVFDLKPTS